MKSLKAKLLLLLATTVVITVLTGCSQGTPPPKPDPTAVRHDKKNTD